MDEHNNSSKLAIIKPNSAGAVLSDADFKGQLEALALEIEQLKCTTIFKIALRVGAAHELFLYRRDEGGFQGWAEDRLGFSRAHAYRLVDVARLAKVSQAWDTYAALPATAIYRIASRSTPVSAREEILRRLRLGERLTGVTVCKIIAKIIDAAKPNKPEIDNIENNVIGEEHAPAANDEKHDLDGAVTEPAVDSIRQCDQDRPVIWPAAATIEQSPSARTPTSALENKALPATSWEEATSEEHQLISNSVLEDYFKQAGGSDIFNRIPADKRAEVLAAFPAADVVKVFGAELRKALPANPIPKLRAMDDDLAALTFVDAFGPRLDAIIQKAQGLRAPQGRQAGKRSNKVPQYKLTLPQAGVDTQGNHHFAQQRGTRSQSH
jgi:hypothetical protein